MYITGYTGNTSLVVTSGAHQTTHGGGEDVFIAKFNDSGTREWGTYFGGSSNERGFGLSTDSSSNLYIVGYTESTSGIASNSSHQTSNGGSQDAFLAKFDTKGVLQWGTYFGGSSYDLGWATSIDKSGNVLITGQTSSSTGIATSAAYQTTNNGTDAFIAKFNANGVLQWGTYFGGSSNDAGKGIGTDGGDNIYLTGQTESTSDIATSGAHQTSLAGSYDAFIVKFNKNGALQWGTYNGGSSVDGGTGISVDLNGNVYVIGNTQSNSGIATAGAYDSTYEINCAFISKFNNKGVRIWGTYYDSGQLVGNGISIYGCGDIYVTGNAFSPYVDAFITKFSDTTLGILALLKGDTSVCSGVLKEYTLDAGPGLKYTWVISGGTITSGQGKDTVKIVWSGTGKGSLKVVLSTPASCKDSLTLGIDISQQPSAFSGNDTSICIGSSVGLGAGTVTGNSYSWTSKPIGFTSSKSRPLVSPTKTTTYYLTETVTATGCSKTDSVTITVHQLPKAIFTASDVCKSTPVSFINSSTPDTGMLDYLWFFGDGDTSTLKSPSHKFLLAGKYTVKLVVTNINGCKDSISHSVKVDSTCVWPGDANADKVVDNKDILAIGVAYSDTGSSRADTSITWNAHLVKDWSNNFSSGQNYKHADCNGDGIVSYTDTLAVTRNYSKTHAKKESKNRGKNTDPVLKVDIQNDSLKAGDTLVAYILLGENALPAKDVYGLAFSLNYNKDIFSSVSVDYTGNWLGLNTLGYSNNTNSLDLALTRTDHQNVTGSGRIATIKFTLDESQELDLGQIKLEIADNILISANEQVMHANIEDDSVKIYKEPNSIIKSNFLEQAQLRVYPNPFTSQTNIEFTLQRSSTVSMIIYDMTGKSYLVFKSTKQPQGKNTFGLDTKPYNFPAGMYVLKVLIDGVPTYKRIAKTD